MKRAAKFLVSGSVQGVFYRKFVKEHADSLLLKGYVRNLKDGGVEVLVEGEEKKIEELEEKLKEGPEFSQVRKVDREERKWTGEFKEFKILLF